jgi:hypothetical protein
MNLGIQGLRIRKIPKSHNSLIPEFQLIFHYSTTPLLHLRTNDLCELERSPALRGVQCVASERSSLKRQVIFGGAIS